jgi:hypothetical protein
MAKLLEYVQNTAKEISGQAYVWYSKDRIKL